MNNFSLIFDDNPIARAYLQLFEELEIKFSKIIILNKKSILPNSYIEYEKFLNANYWPIKFCKNKKYFSFIENCCSFFSFDKSFLLKMYKFKSLRKLSNRSIYLNNSDINSDIFKNYLNDFENENFLISSHQIVKKKILETNNNFYHIHPGYLPYFKGADCSLWSILKSNNVGSSIFLLNENIDDGEILFQKRKQFKKIFSNYNEKSFTKKEFYRLWFSFFDPLLRVDLLRDIINKKNLNQLKNFNKINEENYYSFMKEDDLKDVILKIFN